MVALLWLDRPDACASHFSAAALWALAALGWLVIHVTYREMKSGMDRVIVRIKNALAPRLDHLR